MLCKGDTKILECWAGPCVQGWCSPGWPGSRQTTAYWWWCVVCSMVVCGVVPYSGVHTNWCSLSCLPLPAWIPPGFWAPLWSAGWGCWWWCWPPPTTPRRWSDWWQVWSPLTCSPPRRCPGRRGWMWCWSSGSYLGETQQGLLALARSHWGSSGARVAASHCGEDAETCSAQSYPPVNTWTTDHPILYYTILYYTLIIATAWLYSV